MSCSCDTANCGCCAGVEAVTPRAIDNRPGLASLAVRIGTHGEFMASMQARLSTHRFGDTRPLAGLKTRDRDDPAIALLDAFAVASDVLTFYNERISDESYLRTATSFRSVQELARLVGYTPRPGVAASVFLAFTIEPGTMTPVNIARGTRVQSVPGPDEAPQIFETSLDLDARASWNTLGLRRTEPQQLAVAGDGRLYLAGTTTGLKPGDALLYEFAGSADPVPMRVLDVEITGEQTVVRTQAWDAAAVGAVRQSAASRAAAATAAAAAVSVNEAPIGKRLAALATAASTPPASAARLVRAPAASFASGAGAALQITGVAAPGIKASLNAAIAGYGGAAPPQPVRVFAMRVRAGLFGRTFAKRSATIRSKPSDNVELIATEEIGEWPIVFQRSGEGNATGREAATAVSLDAAYDGISPGSLVLVDMRAVPGPPPAPLLRAAASTVLARAVAVEPKAARADYGGSGDSTRLQLDRPWIKYGKFPEAEPIGAVAKPPQQQEIDREFQLIRRTTVYMRPEALALAERPITTPFCAHAGTVVELDAFYADLEAGRYVIVSGERADIAGTRGVFASEVAMIASVVNEVRTAEGGTGPRNPELDDGESVDDGLPGDRTHSFIEFAAPLSYCYFRETVVIHGNVVKASHGETRREPLGNGDAAKPNQAFALKHKPLTFVPAATARGAASTLEVFVDDIRWHEVPHLVDALPTDHSYMLSTGADGHASAVFGDGVAGARPPTGQSNIGAVYRTGIGRSGNVRARQIEQLADRPLGVREVVNPRAATGGADPEGRDQARRNAPLATLALDRLVSVRDHADFSRTSAGIAKANARMIGDGARQLVHLTIAAEGDAPLDATSDLLIALRRALLRLGDPFSPVHVAPRELRLLIVAAKIRLQPDRRWENVVAAVRARALERFGFDARDLGEGLAPSAVIAALQAVPGVAYVDLDTFGSVATMTTDADGDRVPVTPDATTAAVAAAADKVEPWLESRPARFEAGLLLPAELLMLSPDVPATLILNEVE